MKILLCGSSGLLGKELSLFFENENIEHIGTYNSNIINSNNHYKIDFNNLDEIENIIKSLNITVCINCIVERIVETCENDWNKIDYL